MRRHGIRSARPRPAPASSRECHGTKDGGSVTLAPQLMCKLDGDRGEVEIADDLSPGSRKGRVGSALRASASGTIPTPGPVNGKNETATLNEQQKRQLRQIAMQIGEQP